MTLYVPERTKVFYEKLYPYYKKTVDFMLTKYYEDARGILIAHSPGLGKTPITCVFLSSLFEALEARFFLVVVPKSVIDQWRQHLLQWAQVPILVYHGPKDSREADFKKLLVNQRGIIVTTYQMLLYDYSELYKRIIYLRVQIAEEHARRQGVRHPKITFTSTGNDFLDERLYSELNAEPVDLAYEEAPEVFRRDFKLKSGISFDVAVFDEITEIKNENSKSFRAFNFLYVYMKVGLTGTPVMNNLKELYNIVHFLAPGFLGYRKAFVNTYAHAIFEAQLKDANYMTREIGKRYQTELIAELSKIMFRQTKEQLHALDCSKHEILLWMNMTDLQLTCYESYINSQRFKRQFDILQTDKLVPFQVISMLRKTAEHCLKYNGNELASLPKSLRHHIALLQIKEKVVISSDTESEFSNSDSEAEPTDSTVHSAGDDIYSENPSSKVDALLFLLYSFKERGLKTIVFTEHRTMLNFIQRRISESLHVSCVRLDGKVTSIKDRAAICSNFNKHEQFQILLMTIRAGGIGLNLQGAKRVIIFSPNWNPQIEEQAIGRAWRLGQEEDVYVYKLITRNTIEEKLVARQFYKLQIANAATKDLDAKVKVKAAEILELLICRTRNVDNRYKILQYQSAEEIEGVEKALSNSFNAAEFMKQISEQESQMLEQIKSQLLCYNVQINQPTQYVNDEPQDCELDEQDKEMLKIHISSIPSISDLRSQYYTEGQAEGFEGDEWDFYQLSPSGQHRIRSRATYSVSSLGRRREEETSATAHTSQFEDDGKSQLFDVVLPQGNERFGRYTAQYRSNSASEDDIGLRRPRVPRPNSETEIISTTVPESSVTVLDSDVSSVSVGQAPEVVDIDDIDVFQLTQRQKAHADQPAVVDLSD